MKLSIFHIVHLEWMEVCNEPFSPPEIIDLLEPLPSNKLPHVVSLFIYFFISRLQNPKPNLFSLSFGVTHCHAGYQQCPLFF